jgi:hypothetical protein
MIENLPWLLRGAGWCDEQDHGQDEHGAPEHQLLCLQTHSHMIAEPIV